MIVSTDWLAEYVRVTAPVEELVERLALSGLNHESTSTVGDDTAIEIEVTSNRADCLGHIGVAREVSVLYKRPLLVPSPRPVFSVTQTLVGFVTEGQYFVFYIGRLQNLLI